MAFTKATAGVVHLLYGFLVFISEQVIIDTAIGSFLRRWAKIWGIEPIPATFTQLTIKMTGIEGSSTLQNTLWKRADGVEFIQDEDATIGAETPAQPESSLITTVSDNSFSLAGSYFLYNTPSIEYYFFFNVDGVGNDPGISGRTGVQVSINEDDTADQVAAALRIKMDEIVGIDSTVATNQVTATNSDGGVVDNTSEGGTPTGFTFGTIQEGTEIIPAFVDIQVTAKLPGASSNTDNDEILSLDSPAAGVDQDATIIATVLEGEEEESDEKLLVRLLQRIQFPPAGGKASDYIAEALKVPGIEKAFVYPNRRFNGSVDVAVLEEDNGIPSAAKVQEVQDQLDSFRQVTADVLAFAPIPITKDLTIRIKPFTATVIAAAEAQLTDLFLRDAAPKGALKGVSDAETGTILRSRVDESVSVAQGEEDHFIVSPTSGDLEVANSGEIAIKGTITWQNQP